MGSIAECVPGEKKSQKPGLNKDHKAPQEQLRFINVSDPISIKSKASKRIVHAFVARATHQKIRRDRVVKFQRSDHGGRRNEQPPQAKKPQAERQEVVLRQSSQYFITALDAPLPAINTIAGPTYGCIDKLGSGRKDPFHSYAAQLTPFEQYLVDHFIQFVIPQSATYYPRSKTEPDYHESMTLHWMSFAITRPDVMNGLFSTACRSLALLYKTGSYLRKAFIYNERFIRSIMEAISEDGVAASSDSTIVKVLILASAEFHDGNLSGSRDHMNAISEMVKLKGGLQNLGLGGFLRQLVLWHDRTTTSYIGTSPKFLHVASFEENVSVEALSPGFRDRLILSQLSMDMINILNDLCVYTSYTNNLSTPWSESEHRILWSSANEFDARLLVLSSDYQNPLSSREYSQTEECLFLSLRVFVSVMPHEFSFPPMGCDHLAARIRTVLSEIMLQPSWHHCADLLLWMTFMGSIVARAGKAKEQELPHLFADLRKQADSSPQLNEAEKIDPSFWIFKIMEISSMLNSFSKVDVKAHLRRFLRVETLCEAYSRDIWSSLERMPIGFGWS